MLTRFTRRLSLGLMLLMLAPILASGAGLGRIKVNSGLGEPLSADIELVETSPEDASSLVARLATSDEYSTAGLQDVIIPQGIRISPATRADGSRVLHITSSKPVNDPFLELLIHVDTNTVHLVRQYTILLDPPLSKMAEEPDASATAKPSASNVPPVVATENVPERPKRRHRSNSANNGGLQATGSSEKTNTTATTAPAKSPETTGDTYTTQNGDVFGKVAQRYQPEGISLKKVMSAFYKANPDAFLNGDMNQLKVGQVLRIPSPEAMGAAKPQLAEVPSSPAQSESTVKTPGPSASGKPDNSKFVLQISPGDTESAQQEEQAPANPGTQTPAVAAPSLEGQQPPKTPENATPAAPADSAPTIPTAKPTPQAPPSLAEQANQDQPGFVDTMFDRMLWVGLGILLSLAIAGLIYLFHLRRLAALRKLQDEALFAASASTLIDEEEEFFKPSRSRAKPVPVPAPFAENSVDSHTQTQELPSASTGMQDHGPIENEGSDFDIHEVDPLVEAEIYISYGRSEQAEGILTHALEKHPERHELSMALLRIYADRKDTAAFEHVALKIREAAESGGENEVLWGKAALLGKQIDSDNPLYDIEDIQDETPKHVVATENPFADFDEAQQVEQAESQDLLKEALPHSHSDEPLSDEPPAGQLTDSLQESNVLEFTFEPITEHEPLEASENPFHQKDEPADFENFGLDELFPTPEGDEKKQGNKNKPA